MEKKHFFRDNGSSKLNLYEECCIVGLNLQMEATPIVSQTSEADPEAFKDFC